MLKILHGLYSIRLYPLIFIFLSLSVIAKQIPSEFPPINRDYYPIQSSGAGELGDWGQANYCVQNSYIFAAKIMVEEPQGGGDGDDTSLNQVTFVCKNPKTNSTNTFKVGLGQFGNYDSRRWKDAKCQDGYFAYGFRLGMEGGVANDYVGATSIRLLCREFSSWNDTRSSADAIGEFHKEWLDSRICMFDHLLAGAVARSQEHQGGSDDSALNDIAMICKVE